MSRSRLLFFVCSIISKIPIISSIYDFTLSCVCLPLTLKCELWKGRFAQFESALLPPRIKPHEVGSTFDESRTCISNSNKVLNAICPHGWSPGRLEQPDFPLVHSTKTTNWRSRLEQLGMKIDEWHRIEKSQIWNGSQVSFQKKKRASHNDSWWLNIIPRLSSSQNSWERKIVNWLGHAC